MSTIILNFQRRMNCYHTEGGMESQQILEIVHETNDSGMALCNNNGGREVQGVLDAVLIVFADALGG